MIRITRRFFLYLYGVTMLATLFSCRGGEDKKRGEGLMASESRKNIGIGADGKSIVFLARYGTSEQNMRKVM